MSQTTSLPRDLDWNGAFLRDLARSLLRDPADAEDVGQEAWIASWRHQKKHGPLDPERAPGWLATVLPRRRGTLLRSGERRRQREAVAARPEPLPSAAESAGRIELAETLLSLVRDLDEPVRTAIIARYYDGLGVEAIGRRESTSASTIRSRIERGLVQLREQLDRRDPEGRAGWMSAFSGFVAQQVGQGGGTVAGGIAPWMGLTVAGALAAGAAVVWLVPALAGSEPAPATDLTTVARVPDEPDAIADDSSSSLAPLPAGVSREEAPILEQEPDVAKPAAPNRSGRVVNALPNGQVEAASNVVVRWKASAKNPPTLQGLGYVDSGLGSISYGGTAGAPSPSGPNVATTADDGRYRWRTEPSGEDFLVLVEGDALYQDVRWEGTAAEWDALPRPLEWRRERHLTLRGRVEDLEGQPLPEVSIRATGKSGAIERKTESDEEGRFSFMDPGPGGLVKAERPGWIMCSAEKLRKLTQEGAASPTIVMARAGQLEMRFAGETSGIESASAQVSLAEVPLNGPLATEGVKATISDDRVAVLERLPVG